jgi:AcrR family transcriptional regulator
VRNHEALLDAATRCLDEEGWAGLALGRVSKAAGLSISPARARFTDRNGLAVALWRERLAGPAVSALTPLLSLAGSGQALAADALGQALDPFVTPDRTLRCAVELIIVARYEPTVGTAVRESLGPVLDDALMPARGRLTRADAARRAYLLIVALGLLLEGRRPGVAQLDLSPVLQAAAEALSAPASPVRLPAASATHLDAGAVFATGDPAWDRLLQASLDEIGSRGYDAATVDVIARASGSSQGLLFGRYATKRDLFLDATRRMLGEATALNVAFQERIGESHSLGIAEAVMLREWMDPRRFTLRTIGLEQYRVGWHDPEMQAAMDAEQAPVIERLLDLWSAEDGRAVGLARVHLARAAGMGPLLLADLHPDAYLLPYDVVTEPLSALTD